MSFPFNKSTLGGRGNFGQYAHISEVSSDGEILAAKLRSIIVYGEMIDDGYQLSDNNG